MSPSQGVPLMSLSGFPRVSGDEPAPDDVWAALRAFSPRERG